MIQIKIPVLNICHVLQQPDTPPMRSHQQPHSAVYTTTRPHNTHTHFTHTVAAAHSQSVTTQAHNPPTSQAIHTGTGSQHRHGRRPLSSLCRCAQNSEAGSGRHSDSDSDIQYHSDNLDTPPDPVTRTCRQMQVVPGIPGTSVVRSKASRCIGTCASGARGRWMDSGGCCLVLRLVASRQKPGWYCGMYYCSTCYLCVCVKFQT